MCVYLQMKSGYEPKVSILLSLGSTNGTFMDGRLLAGREFLQIGSIIQIGDTPLDLLSV
jgi:pSer/pThr/pTyr-binding forkhead associated (FHA) protein